MCFPTGCEAETPRNFGWHPADPRRMLIGQQVDDVIWSFSAGLYSLEGIAAVAITAVFLWVRERL
jgi:hypothetical protein